MKASRLLTLAALFAAFAASPAWAFPIQTLADWQFETSLPVGTDQTDNGPHTPEAGLVAGTAEARGHHASSLADWSNPAGNGSSDSWSVTNWGVGDYFQFRVNTTGYSCITFEWDQTSSNTGPRDFTLSFGTDGSSFTNAMDYSVLANGTPNPAWNATTSSAAYHFSVNLCAETSLDNAATAYFRLSQRNTTSANGGTVAATGTGRVDNVRVLTPEPSTLAFLGLGITALIRRRR